MDLNPQQKLAVQADDKPLLIVAGAGTGKTRTLAGRLAYLIERGVPAERIVAITFTNKAANEMRSRISTHNLEQITNNNVIGYRSSVVSPFIGTFHSFGAKILRKEAKLLGRNSNFVIFDDSDSLQIAKKIIKSILSDKDVRSGAAAMYNGISRVKNGIEGIQSAASGLNLDEKFFGKIFLRYEKELQKNNAFDFDDLIVKVVEIFKNNPKVLEKYRRRFHHILVDEYQDLNNKQYELIRLLVGDSPRISVVGDDQQMIYGFRGSNYRIFMDFENDWPEANVILLEENYRSTSNIIKAASALISNNVNQKPKELWTKNDSGEPIAIIEASDEDDEAEWIADKIESRIMNNELRMKNNINEKSIIHNSQFTILSTAVLYRTNAQSRAIEQALIEKGIPYQIFGGLRFYERKEIKDIVAALRYAQNRKDEVSRERLEKNITKSRFAKFAARIEGNEKTLPPAKLMQNFLESTGYIDVVERTSTNAEERRENIAELLHFASGFGDLRAFLEQVALLQPTDVATNKLSVISNQSSVNLMTIHLAKGLEFNKVFVAGCNEGLLPHNRSLKNAWEVEEERRLMYVAMTRAMKELFLSFYDIPSRFLGEVPEELVKFESLVSEGRNFSDLDNEERYITLD